MTAAERRIQVLDILLAKRKTTTSALANEFHVSTRFCSSKPKLRSSLINGSLNLID